MMSLAGIGYDSHRLVAGRRLILGGVEIPGELGLEGHSDADVLTHAVIDALLGAAGLGDIGEHFPDSDERFRDADSSCLLTDVLTEITEAGMAVLNVDCTIVMEIPKLGEYKQAIRTCLGVTLGLPRERVNVKATTGEGIGFVGRGEGVAALAIASLGELSGGGWGWAGDRQAGGERAGDE
jgi:2-C-methyl-D-erythritol 2,4-cyclodiphosphate synthase